MYSQNLIMENIPALLEMQNKKKGDLDKVLGHSNGYLANKKAGELTWKQMNVIADFFCTDINDLLNHDYTLDAEVQRLTIRKADIENELAEINNRLSEVGCIGKM